MAAPFRCPFDMNQKKSSVGLLPRPFPSSPSSCGQVCFSSSLGLRSLAESAVTLSARLKSVLMVPLLLFFFVFFFFFALGFLLLRSTIRESDVDILCSFTERLFFFLSLGGGRPTISLPTALSGIRTGDSDKDLPTFTAASLSLVLPLSSARAPAFSVGMGIGRPTVFFRPPE